MRNTVLLCCGLGALLYLLASPAAVEAKTVFRRRDKISEDFKQLNLAQEEIDPNVAPPEPQKVETLSPADVSTPSTAADTEPLQEMIVDEAAEATNEISDAVADAATADEADVVEEAVSAAAASAATPAPVAATPAPAAAAVAATDGSESAAAGLSKYCKCSDKHCDCCRDFGIPLLPLRGPGCAKITYLGNERMSIAIRYGDITLASRTISSKRARPVCVGLPGGYSKFCGRVYGLAKTKDNFKACLGFELRADDEVEAALRVSCFKFGPEGLRVAEAEPLPSEVAKPQEEEDEDDDIFGFGGATGGDDDDDEDEDYEDDDAAAAAAEADDAADDEEYGDDDEDETPAVEEAPEDADYGGFSLAGLLEELADDEDEVSVKPPAAATIADTPPAAATRTAVQSKDDKGTVAQAAETAVEAAEAAVEGDMAAGAATTTTVTKKKKKGKRNNKAKKNKKKKTAAATTEAAESSLAYEILNGILEFFN